MAQETDARTLSIWIDRDPQRTYAFASVPENFPAWASGLCQSIARKADAWIAQTPGGPMKVRFTETNGFGVLDHYVEPPEGAAVYVPMRVVAHGRGSEVLLTLFRQPGMTDGKFEEDARWVARDLKRLKEVLEARLA